MNTRILSVAALTGMLAATGCGGGSGPGAVTPTTGLAPTIGGGVGASSSKRSLSISLRIPTPAALQTSSASRHPQYVSPGTTGVSLFLTTAYSPANLLSSPAGAATEATAAVTALTAATPTEILTNFVPTSLAGTFSLSGTAITTLTGSSSASASYTIALSGSYSILTLTIPNVVGDATISSVLNHQFVRVGAVFTDSTGYVLSEGQAPSVPDAGTGPAATAAVLAATGPNSISNYQIANAGPTEVPLILSPVPSTVYLFGSTGVLGALGPPITPNQAAGTAASANSYEVTAYLADHAGFVIPAQDVAFSTSTFLPTTVSNAITAVGTASLGTAGSSTVAGGVPTSGILAFDGGATVDFTTNASTLVTVAGAPGEASTTLSNSTTLSGGGVSATPVGLDPIPTSAQATTTGGFLAAAAFTPVISTPGYLVNAVSLPSGTVSGYGSYVAGYGINAKVLTTTAAASGASALLYGVINEANLNSLGSFGPSAAHGLVAGFSYTASNYPSSTTSYLGTPGSPTTPAQITIPLAPSVVPVIQ